ncbi:MAG TPA: O-antigen ligase family protein [Acidimicrobiales bacterium]|nr:O-antigen ligase family protein [Acidimicrobiales bacterium]
MSRVILLMGGLVVSTMLFYVFVQWERSAREHWVVFLLLGMLIVESSLYGNFSDVPRGIFHPGAGSFQFRTPEVIITVALLARMAVKGLPTRIGVPALAWLAVAGWLSLEIVEGILRHNSTTYIPYEAKAIVYVVGGYALVAGVPVRRFIDGRGFERTLRWSALLATALVLMTAAKFSYSAKLPLIPLSHSGPMGTDSAALFATIGLIGLLLELAKDRRSRLNLLATVPLLLGGFFAFQRAVLLMIGAAIVFVLVVALGRTARQRLRVRMGEILITALAVVGVVLGVSVIPAITAQRPVQTPFASTIGRNLNLTLNSGAKAESAQARLNKWNVALGDARQHPILGEGLGFTYTYYVPGPNQFVTTDLTENIGLDLLLRTGVIGLVLFLIALVASLVNGFAAWRMHPDRLVAVLALALVAVIVGMIAQGQVESIFENYRIATLLGLSLGLLRSAVTSGGGTMMAMRTFGDYRHYEVV